MPGLLKRGFAAEANRKAIALRAEIGLGEEDVLDPVLLAEHLGVLVIPLSELGGSEEIAKAVNRLMVHDTPAFSGCCIEADGRFAIVINDAHSSVRQAATVAHELGHVILGHTAEAHFDEFGMREYDAKKEAEADRLGDSLLIPDKPAKFAILNHGSLDSAADHFGVSLQLMRKRFNMSGGQAIMKRRAAAR